MKIVIINSCNECPHFDFEYYEYLCICTKLDRKVPGVGDIFIMPEECPLETAEER